MSKKNLKQSYYIGHKSNVSISPMIRFYHKIRSGFVFNGRNSIKSFFDTSMSHLFRFINSTIYPESFTRKQFIRFFFSTEQKSEEYFTFENFGSDEVFDSISRLLFLLIESNFNGLRFLWLRFQNERKKRETTAKSN